MTTLLDTQERLPAVFARERAALVRRCARLTGDPTAAEDLAQETLLEAWRHRDGLRAPDRMEAWLAGIARNVCLRWGRTHARTAAHQLAPLHATSADNDPMPAIELALAAPEDFEVELERQELVALLDRALALLPVETRAALVAHYVDESPLAEIAARLGASASAVAMRLQRGRLALRRVLATEFAGELSAYLGDGMASDSDAAAVWEETPLWCSVCGRHHLLGRYHREEGEWWLRCPECSPDANEVLVHTNSRAILGGVKSYKRAFERLWAWVNAYYPPHLSARAVPCLRCGRTTPLRQGNSDQTALRGVTLEHDCPACDTSHYISLDALILAHPAGRRFQQRHPRLRLLPREEVEAQGRLASVTTYESITSAERLVAVTANDTFELLSLYGGPAEMAGPA